MLRSKSAQSLRDLLNLQGLSCPSDLSDIKGMKLLMHECWRKELKLIPSGTLRSRKIQGESRASSRERHNVTCPGAANE